MAKNTVKLKKYLDVIEEYEASGTITPGMLLEFDSDGKVKAHSDESDVAVPMFALEDELQGNGINDDYDSGDRVQVWVPQRGEQVYAIPEFDETIAIGDYLVSAGNGKLQKYTADSGGAYIPNMIVAQALEAVTVDSSGEYTENQRLKVRIV